MRKLLGIVVVLGLIVAAWPVSSQQGSSDLEALKQRFETPPDDSRVIMRWWWFGPSVTHAQLARELTAMKEAGIGGVEIQPVYPLALDDEAKGIKNLPFLSDEFLAALRFTSKTARDLGLRVDLTLGSGWPFGGPQVSIADAAGRLRVERVPIAAGQRRVALPGLQDGERMFSTLIAEFKGDAIVPDSVRDLTSVSGAAIDGDIVELKTPFDRPHALMVFINSRTGMMVKRAAIGSEGFVLNHYDRPALDRYLASVGDRLMTAFDKGAAPAPFAIFCDSLEVFGSDWNDDFLDAFQQKRGYDLRPHLPALAADMGPKTAAIRHDWGLTLTELLNERFLAPMKEWSAKQQTRFRVQGYGIPPATMSSNRFADLPEGEGYQWRSLTSSRWAASASHIYGHAAASSETWTWLHSPSYRATPLDMKAEADLHFLQGITQLIGHGWPYTSEGVDYPGWRFYAAAVFNDSNPWFIAMPDVSRYLQRVSFMMRQGAPANDVAFYLPVSDAYASFTVGRSIHLLDVLKERIGSEVMGRIFDAGFNLDVIDDDALRLKGKVEGDALVLGGGNAGNGGGSGNRYRAIVLPDVERLPLDTLRTLDAFVRGGGTLIATKRLPAIAPGFRATDAEHAEVRDTIARLFKGPKARAKFVADEKEIGAALREAMLPDVEILVRPMYGAASTSTPASTSAAPAQAPVPTPMPTATSALGIVHRRLPYADVYFIANTSNRTQATGATFRVTRKRAAWWNPMTGETLDATSEPSKDGSGRMTVAVRLEPYESQFLVFADNAPRASSTARRSAAATAASGGGGAGGANGSSGASAPSGTSIDLATGWTVSFAPTAVTFNPRADALKTPAARATTAMPVAKLHSWTDDEATRHFSGTAAYELRVNVPAAMVQPGRRLTLDFGVGTPVSPPATDVTTPSSTAAPVRQRAWIESPVREAAVVYVNDKRAGAVWAPPYAVDVTPFLTPGENRLRVVVGNTAINHLAGRPLPSYRLLNLRHGERFTPQDMKDLQPLPSGILGPVRLFSHIWP
jgi:alpha-L-rhamnosidase